MMYSLLTDDYVVRTSSTTKYYGNGERSVQIFRDRERWANHRHQNVAANSRVCLSVCLAVCHANMSRHILWLGMAQAG